MTDVKDTIARAAARFELPTEWVQLHQGRHRCVDNKWYTDTCLVTDPTCERIARSYMRMARCESLGRPAECLSSCRRVWCHSG